MFDFDINKLDLTNELGGGSFGIVYPYDTDKKWVVKCVKAEKTEDLLMGFREIIIGFSCDHPCLVPIKGYFIEKTDHGDKVYLKLPRMKEALDADFRRRQFSMNFYEEAVLVKYLYSLALGLSFFHERRIFHRDIKMNNILLDEKGNVRLTDVGLSKYVASDHSNDLLSDKHGAENFKPPELIQHERLLQNKKYKDSDLLKKDSLPLMDSWSLGLTILELCGLRNRFYNPLDSFEKIEETFAKKREEIEKVNKYRKNFLDLVFHLVALNPNNRLKVSDLKTRLEEEFKEIITEDFKASLERLNENQEEIERRKIVEDLRDDLKNRLNEHPGFKKIIQDLQKTLKGLFSNSSDIAKYLRTEEELRVYKEKMNNIILKLQEKWKDYVDIKSDEDCMFVNIKRDEITDQELEDWVKDFVKECQEVNFTEDIIELEIVLSECKEISDVGVKSLAVQIGHSLKSLQHLHLNFFSCWKITDTGMNSLSEYIGSQLKTLQHLCLNFSHCVSITDEGLESLGVHIASKLKSLQHLNIDFRSCRGITDAGVQKLAECIGNNLNNLQDLHLNFRQCKEITDIGLTDLGECLTNKPNNLQHLDLDFRGCHEITDTGVKSFGEHVISKPKNLKHLHLNFQGCRDISGEIKKSLKEKLIKTIQVVEII